MQIFTKKFTLLLTLFLMASCTSTKIWVYRAGNNDGFIRSNLQSKIIVVKPFTDKRSNENKDNIMLCAIPFRLFGYQKLSSPEAVLSHANSDSWDNYSPKEDFAKAMAKEFKSADIFKKSYFSNSTINSDYYIDGEILSTDYTSKVMSYGISIYGPVLWLIGFPATHVSNDLEVKLTLIKTDSKEIVFSKTYKSDQYKKLGWIYNIPNDFYYSKMLGKVYKEFLADLVENGFIKKGKKN